MAKRHIVLISQIPLWSMDRGAGGPAFRETLAGLARRYRISLVAPGAAVDTGSSLPADVTAHPFKHRFHGRWRQVPKLGWLADTAGWYAFARDAWPIVEGLCSAGDVDGVYGYEIYGVPVARRAADRFGLPMIARFQGSLMTWRRHERLAEVRYRKHLAALRTPADLVVMTDDGTLGDKLLRDLGHPDERVLFLRNGVDVRLVAESSEGPVLPDAPVPPDAGALLAGTVPTTAPVLLAVSRLVAWKRVDRAVLALAELARRGSDAHLVVAGTGPPEGRLRELAVAHTIADRVHFVGAVPYAQLAGLYSRATALLSLYDYSNLANPVMEAMVSGCPVVAFDSGGTARLVRDGVNGVLVRDASPNAVADAVEPLLADPARADALARDARAWAAENLWSWDERIAAEADRIDALLAPRPARP